MAKLTRNEVVARCYDMYPKCGYIFAVVWPGSSSRVMCGITKSGYGSTSVEIKPYIATECSGFVSWCWGLQTKHNTTGFNKSFPLKIARQNNSNVLEEAFPGILPGDAPWRSGHIGLYVGNNTVMDASQTYWLGTTSGHGMSTRTGVRTYTHVIKFDSEYSAYYDPDEQDPVDSNISDGTPGQPITPPDLSPEATLYYPANNQYWKRRPGSKIYRRF